MRIIGDVHGKIKEYIKLATGYVSVQVGDMGCGFVPVTTPKNAYFIRGNHDEPLVARRHPAYLGDYGVQQLDNREFFFLSGAWSIDRAYRREGYDWWREEELNIIDLNDAFDLYANVKPKLVITHDAPNQAVAELLQSVVYPTRTGQALTSMFATHQPELWVFGHHHQHFDKEINGTRFVCLNELEVLDI